MKRGEHVLIPGIGGGVATFAMLFAKAIGAKVSVTSRVENKMELAAKYGADISFIVPEIGKRAYKVKSRFNNR